MKAMISMYCAKTMDCKIDNVMGSSIRTLYEMDEIPKKLTIAHERGITTDASLVSTRRSNVVALYCCGGKLFVNVTWETESTQDAMGEMVFGDEYIAARNICDIWEERTPQNRVVIERFIWRTIRNIRKFARRTYVWGEELSLMWDRVGDELEFMMEISHSWPREVPRNAYETDHFTKAVRTFH